MATSKLRRRNSVFLNTARAVVALLLFGGTMAVFPTAVAANTGLIVVNSTGDQPDANATDGLCRTSSGTCTLRAAIKHGNDTWGDNTIHFNIPGGGVQTIDVGSTFPEINSINGALTIDGYTQPGSAPNTAATGSNANLRIELRGVTNGEPMFNVISAANTFRGLAAYRSNLLFNFEGQGADGNRIIGNFIGTNAAGTFENSAGGLGVQLKLGAGQNVIGTKALADRNVIAGNGSRAIRIDHETTTDNLIQNNVLGLKPDLSGNLDQWAGIDIQWRANRNMIGGFEPGQGNLISGHSYMAVDLSHGAGANLVVGNFIGTKGDGNSAAAYTKNRYAIGMKDFPNGSYIANNVMGGNDWSIWSRHNYSADNNYVNNRIGVGINGGLIPNQRAISQSGVGDVWYGNMVAETSGLMTLTNEDGPNDFFSYPSYTHRNTITQGQYYQIGAGTLMSKPAIDIGVDGLTPNDAGDADTGIQDLLNWPEITGIGPGKVFGTACGWCKVEVYVSGARSADGQIDTSSASPGVGLAWIATAQADASGNWSLGENRIIAGRALSTLAIDNIGNTSELPPGQIVPGNHTGANGNANGPSAPIGAPAPPPLPIPYNYSLGNFACAYEGGILNWTAVGAASYQVYAVAADGTETSLGQHGGSSLATPAAASFRVTYNSSGQTFDASCLGPSSGISGSVADLAGQAVPSTNIDLFNENRTTWIESTSTDQAGQYQFDVNPGCYTLTFIAPAPLQFSTGTYNSQSVCVDDGGAGTVDATILANGGSSLQGTVTDANGAGMANVTGSLYTSDQAATRIGYLSDMTTDSNGAFQIDAAPGCYVLTLIAPVNETFVESRTQWLNLHTCITSGQNGTLGPATVNSGGVADAQLAGIITNGAGQPTGNVLVDLFEANGDGTRGTWLDSGTSNASGAFNISTPAGCYVFTYSAPSGSTWAQTGTQWWNRAFCVDAAEVNNGFDAQLN